MGFSGKFLVLTALTRAVFLSNILCQESVHQTTFIGVVGKKLYVVLRDKQNWAKAKFNCEDGGFKLATIRDVTELQFLEKQYKYGFFHGWHWIAARDRRAITQFVWDEDDSDISIQPKVITDGTFGSTTTFLTCGAFAIDDKGSGVSIVDCSNENGYALCEVMLP